MISLGFLLTWRASSTPTRPPASSSPRPASGRRSRGRSPAAGWACCGMRPVLLLTTIAVCAVEPDRRSPWPSCRSGATWSLGAITGLSYPPIQPAVRTIYPKMVNSRQLTPLFSLDASAQEIIWIAGPVVVTFVGDAGLDGRGRAAVRRVPDRRRHLVRARRPRSGACASRAASAGSGPSSPGRPCWSRPSSASWSSARAPRSRSASSRPSARAAPTRASCSRIWAIASLVGGLSFGNLPIGPWALARRVFVIFIGVDPRDLRLGVLVARDHPRGRRHLPRPGARGDVLGRLGEREVQRHRRGVRLGRHRPADRRRRRLGGRRVPRRRGRPGGAFWASAGFALLALAVAAVFHRAMPDLRGRDASPIPDTEGIPTQPS